MTIMAEPDPLILGSGSTAFAATLHAAELAQDGHLQAELAADAGEPVELAAGDWTGGLDDIAEFEQFNPAAGTGDTHQLADNAGPGLGGNGSHQQPLMGEETGGGSSIQTSPLPLATRATGEGSR
jgi:hypothetical protein